MARFALLIGGVFKEFRNAQVKPEDIPHKLVTWHDYVANAQPTFDSATHHAPIKTVGLVANVWTVVWAAPVAKTTQELADEITALKDRAVNNIQAAMSVYRAFAKGFQEHENRLRVLEGNTSTVTFKQVVTWLRGKL